MTQMPTMVLGEITLCEHPVVCQSPESQRHIPFQITQPIPRGIVINNERVIQSSETLEEPVLQKKMCRNNRTSPCGHLLNRQCFLEPEWVRVESSGSGLKIRVRGYFSSRCVFARAFSGCCAILTSPKRGETAVHGYNPESRSVLSFFGVVLMSRRVNFYVVQSEAMSARGIIVFVKSNQLVKSIDNKKRLAS